MLVCLWVPVVTGLASAPHGLTLPDSVPSLSPQELGPCPAAPAAPPESLTGLAWAWSAPRMLAGPERQGHLGICIGVAKHVCSSWTESRGREILKGKLSRASLYPQHPSPQHPCRPRILAFVTQGGCPPSPVSLHRGEYFLHLTSHRPETRCHRLPRCLSSTSPAATPPSCRGQREVSFPQESSQPLPALGCTHTRSCWEHRELPSTSDPAPSPWQSVLLHFLHFRHLWPLKNLMLMTHQVRDQALYLPGGGLHPELNPTFAPASILLPRVAGQRLQRPRRGGG